MRSTPLFLCLAVVAGCADSRIPEPDGAPPPLPTSDCAEGQWCWVRGKPVRIVGGRSLDTIVAVGVEGMFLHWEAGAWTPNPVPTDRTLVSASMLDGNDVWVSDDAGSVWHFDGLRWTERAPDGSISRLSEAADGLIWAHGGGASGGHGAVVSSELFRWDGSGWVVDFEPVTYCMGGDYLALGVDDVWTAGLVCEDDVVVGVEVHHHDGSGWRQVGERIDGQGWYPSLTLFEGRVRFTATGVFEWNDTWREVERPQHPQDLSLGETAVFAGSQWVTMPRSLGCEEAFVFDESNVWCSGDGQIHFRQRAGWTATIGDPFDDTMSAERFGTMPPALWAGSDSANAWGSGPQRVFRIRESTDGALERYDGSEWSTEAEPTVTDVDGGCGGAWFSSDQGLFHRVERPDGSSESQPIALPDGFGDSEVSGVHCLGEDQVAVIADDDTLLTFHVEDGWQPTLLELTDSWTIADVSGDSLEDLWVLRHAFVGRISTTAAIRFDGSEWSELEEWTEVHSDLATDDSGQTWLLRGNEIRRVSPSSSTPIEVDWHPYGSKLWVGPTDFWITTPQQARQRPRG